MYRASSTSPVADADLGGNRAEPLTCRSCMDARPKPPSAARCEVLGSHAAFRLVSSGRAPRKFRASCDTAIGSIDARAPSGATLSRSTMSGLRQIGLCERRAKKRSPKTGQHFELPAEPPENCGENHRYARAQCVTHCFGIFAQCFIARFTTLRLRKGYCPTSTYAIESAPA